ncbi:hypothetical protein DENSPDRAFT_449427 [Dentipellis sp. KUC8613]|nr:hypothetical protein DENSPDRAFT_449427 [Dentipellis sp. KUC8613]
MAIFPALNDDCDARILERMPRSSLLALSKVSRAASIVVPPYIVRHLQISITDSVEQRSIRSLCTQILSKNLAGRIKSVKIDYNPRVWPGDNPPSRNAPSSVDPVADVLAKATSLRSISLIHFLLSDFLTSRRGIFLSLSTLPSLTSLMLINPGPGAFDAVACLSQLQSISWLYPSTKSDDIGPTFFTDLARALNPSSSSLKEIIVYDEFPETSTAVADFHPHVFPNVCSLTLRGVNTSTHQIAPQFPNLVAICGAEDLKCTHSDAWPCLNSVDADWPVVVDFAQQHPLRHIYARWLGDCPRDDFFRFLNGIKHCPVKCLTLDICADAQYTPAWRLQLIADGLPDLRCLNIDFDMPSDVPADSVEKLFDLDILRAFASFKNLRCLSLNLVRAVGAELYDDSSSIARRLLHASGSVQYLKLKLCNRRSHSRASYWIKISEKAGSESTSRDISKEEFLEAEEKIRFEDGDPRVYSDVARYFPF